MIFDDDIAWEKDKTNMFWQKVGLVLQPITDLQMNVNLRKGIHVPTFFYCITLNLLFQIRFDKVRCWRLKIIEVYFLSMLLDLMLKKFKSERNYS